MMLAIATPPNSSAVWLYFRFPLSPRMVEEISHRRQVDGAAVTLAGVELMHMIRKDLLQTTGEVCPARQCDSLAG